MRGKRYCIWHVIKDNNNFTTKSKISSLYTSPKYTGSHILTWPQLNGPIAFDQTAMHVLTWNKLYEKYLKQLIKLILVLLVKLFAVLRSETKEQLVFQRDAESLKVSETFLLLLFWGFVYQRYVCSSVDTGDTSSSRGRFLKHFLFFTWSMSIESLLAKNLQNLICAIFWKIVSYYSLKNYHLSKRYKGMSKIKSLSYIKATYDHSQLCIIYSSVQHMVYIYI